MVYAFAVRRRRIGEVPVTGCLPVYVWVPAAIVLMSFACSLAFLLFALVRGAT